MILELKIKNFLSFKQEVTFSFETTKYQSYEDYQVVEVAPHTRVLRLAIVYGANASGKSNLLEAFEFLRRFWLNKTGDKDIRTEAILFLLDKSTPEEPSEFSLTFFVEGVKYLYTLVVGTNRVFSEKLFVYPGSQPALIFDRKLSGNVSEISFNSKRVKISQVAKEEISIKCLPNMSVLAAYNQVNISIPDLEKVMGWIKDCYSFPGIEPDTEGIISLVENRISKGELSKDVILSFLQRADYNITDINTEIVEEKVPEIVLSFLLREAERISDDKKFRIEIEKTIRTEKTEFEHKIFHQGKEEFYKLSKSLQSKGTLRTLGLSGVIYQATEANAFLAIDEIESSLHPKLVEFIMEDFLKQKGRSQLLLTTHYDGLLEEEDLLRKDSIWFTNKLEDGSTELYSLADFKGLNRISSLQKAYRYGKFGAIPTI